MDKDKTTGLLLIAAIFLAYMLLNKPDDLPADNAPDNIEQVLADTTTTPDNQTLSLPDSVRDQQLYRQYGAYAAGMQGEAAITTLENEVMRVELSSQGGVVKRVLLKDFQTYWGDPLYLVDENSSKFSLTTTTQNGQIDLHTLYYQANEVSTDSTQGVEFTLDLGSGKQLKQTYWLPKGDSYKLGYSVLGEAGNAPAVLTWNHKLKNLERDLEDGRQRSTVNYYTAEEDFEELDKITSGTEETQVDEAVKWIGLNHRFFTAAIIADSPFSQASLKETVDEADTTYLKEATAQLSVPAANIQQGAQFTYFFGPNNYYILDEVTEGFTHNLNIGWFLLRPINKWVIIPIFHFLEQFFSSYGLIIFLLVLFIKLVLSPLSYKSYVGMAKMRVLKPQIDEIKAKHGDDQMKVQQEQMKLYNQLGINPIAGCVPMLLQMPILLAMFYFFPNSIELRQESFLWANDLSTYDSIINLPFPIPFYGDHVSLFCLLMTISQLIYTQISQQTTMSGQPGPMKYIAYITPVMFLFFLNSFPAGLTYYYFLSNLITIGQQLFIRRMVDDEKVMAQLEQNKLKNKDKKKGGFSARLEEALRQGQERSQQLATETEASRKARATRRGEKK
jgi:YidC/Oxa1 family membrane protein insertase